MKLEEFLALRVQTVEWWKHLLAVLLGLGAMCFAGWSLVTGFNVWITIGFGLSGLAVSPA